MNTIEEKVEQLLNELSIAEKVSLCHANSKFTISAVERLGIDELTMSDGPHGVREEVQRHNWLSAGRTDDFCTYLPTNTALASTWNPEMCKTFGKVLGEEARFRGKDIILGPDANIIRHPLCGRNFEYFSEDPCLTSKMLPPLITAIQECDTAACVKHFALNNQELDRGFVNVEVSDRALHEVYLRGFKAAVKEGNAYSFMGAYNRYKNQHCCHNQYLVNDILKNEWGFDGVYLSDWGGVHDTEEAVFCGLDIEMGTNKPYNEYYLADAFEELVHTSPEAMEALNDKVRRILRLMFRINKFSEERKEGSFNTKEHQDATYDIASEAMILLKNDQNKLPLRDAKKLLVVGNNAIQKHGAGGNSSGVKALYEISLLEGIRERFKDCEIEFARTTSKVPVTIPTDQLQIIDYGAGCRAFRCEAYQNSDFSDECFVSYHGGPRIEKGYSSHRYIARLKVTEGHSYEFTFAGNVGDILYCNGDKLCELTPDNGSYLFTLELTPEDTTEFIILSPNTEIAPTLFWDTLDTIVSLDELCEKAKSVDYVIYCGGIDHSGDTESFDRKDMKLPDIQNEEIPALLRANPNTIIAITAGSPVELPWIDMAHTVLWTWYAGMNAGLVFADVLTGKINPSGKLPFTLPYHLEDHPAVRYGEYQAVNCKYNEGIFVGYKGFDKDQIDPMFCFGHGLSYTAFHYSNLSTCQTEHEISVCFTLKNTGDLRGAETAQLYVGRTIPEAGEPLRQLRAFKKVYLDVGEEREVHISLSLEEFKDYNENSEKFELMCNDFTIYIGASSRDLKLTSGNIHIEGRDE